MKLKKNDDNFLNSLSLSFRSNQYVGHYSRALDIIKQNYILVLVLNLTEKYVEVMKP